MRKEDLREAFGKIKPSETLIDDTLMLLRTGERRSEKRERSTFSFTYRLAGAMCAFAIMVGVGVTLGKDIILSPSEDTPAAYGREAFNQVDVFRPNVAPSGMEADMIVEGAKNEGLTAEALESQKTVAVAELTGKGEALSGEWSVVYGTLDGCYFVSDGCIAAISVIENCGGTAFELTDNALVAELQFETDAEKQSFAEAVGESVCLLATEISGEGSVSYRIVDCLILK